MIASTLSHFNWRKQSRQFGVLIAGLPDVLARLVDVSEPDINAHFRDTVNERSSDIKWE